MLRWPVWVRFLVINAALPWAAALLISAVAVRGPAALLAVLSVATVILALNIWHLRASARWWWVFGLVAVLNLLCTITLGNIALATSFGSIRRVLRTLLDQGLQNGAF